jgi:hypothetical protein
MKEIQTKKSRQTPMSGPESGQAAAEFIVVIGAVIVALGAISGAAKYQCIKNAAGDLDKCDSLPNAISSAFKSSVEEITFLINMPF